MTIEPLHDRVLIRPIQEPPKSSTLVVPTHVKEKPRKGTLLAWGSKFAAFDNPIVGDVVLFARHVGDEQDVNGETLLIMRDADLIALVHE